MSDREEKRKDREKKVEKKIPREPDWECIWCQQTVKGGTTHRCNK